MGQWLISIYLRQSTGPGTGSTPPRYAKAGKCGPQGPWATSFGGQAGFYVRGTGGRNCYLGVTALTVSSMVALGVLPKVVRCQHSQDRGDVKPLSLEQSGPNPWV